MVNHVVIGFYRTFAGIHCGKVNSVTAIAINQIVVDMEIELVMARLVARAAVWLAQRRRMELHRAARHIVMNMVPAHVNVVGVRAEINGVIKL